MGANLPCELEGSRGEPGQVLTRGWSKGGRWRQRRHQTEKGQEEALREVWHQSESEGGGRREEEHCLDVSVESSRQLDAQPAGDESPARGGGSAFSTVNGR